MSDENQAAPPGDGFAPPADAPSAPHPAFDYLEAGAAPGPPPPPPGPLPRTALLGALALALLGLAALLLRQVEASLLIAFAALYYTAQGADLHPAMGRVFALLAWFPPVLGALVLAALARALVTTGTPTPDRIGFAVFSGLGAAVQLALLWRPLADRVVRALFRRAEPGHTLRMSAAIVLAVLWVALPAWLAFREQIATLMRDPAALVGTARLSGALVGYVVLAFAAVGFAVRRGLRATLERLGLTALRPLDLLVVLVGVGLLLLVDNGAAWLQKSLFPALWAADQAFTSALAGVMSPLQMLAMSLSAGIGEEITLRGALQPRLGLVLTSVLFAALHVQYSWFGMLSILLFGLLLGLIRRRSGTTASILVHALYNLLAVAFAKP